MLANVMGKGEREYYNFLREIKIGIVPRKIESLLADVWSFRKWKEAGGGRAVLTREKLYEPEYLVYVQAKDTFEQILNSLKSPVRIPSLGMDDEMVVIKDVKELKEPSDIERQESKIVHSIFKLDEGTQYTPKHYGLSEGSQIYPPRVVTVNLDFDETKIPRGPKNFVQIVEFLGAYVELNIPKSLWFDKEKGYYIDML